MLPRAIKSIPNRIIARETRQTRKSILDFSFESTSNTRNDTAIQQTIQYYFNKRAAALYSVIFCSSSFGRALDMWNSQSVHSAIFNNIMRSSRDVHEHLACVVSSYPPNTFNLVTKHFVTMPVRAVQRPKRSA